MTSPDIIPQTLQSGESLTLEFKSSFDRETIETLVAFAYPELTFNVEEIGGGVNEGVNEGVNGLFDVIKSKPGLRTPELARLLVVPHKTIERWIKELKTKKRIVFKGADKTGGYYAIDNDS